MKNPFAWCFGRGKKGRRKPEERKREEPVDDSVRLRYPLFDPRTVDSEPVRLPPAPSERSSSPSVPDELQPDEQIILPKDEEEEETAAVDAKKESPPPSPTPPPPPPPKEESPKAPSPPPAASPVATPPARDTKRKKEEKPKAPSAEATPPRERTPTQERSRSRPTPSGPSSSPQPPSTTSAVAPPSTPREPEASVPPSPPPQSPSPPPAPSESLPSAPPRETPSPRLVEGAPMGKEAVMSPLEKLASARSVRRSSEALEEAEAATAPCTPPARDEGPIAAETEMQQLERTRRLQQKLLALEESLGAEEFLLCHDSTRRRRKVRKEFPRYRVSWRCVQAAIDLYTDTQNGILEDIRMRLDAHEPSDCRICRNFDYSDTPVLP